MNYPVCPHCHGAKSPTAKVCPHCGRDMPPPPPPPVDPNIGWGVGIGMAVGFVAPFIYFSSQGSEGFDPNVGLCAAICCGPIYWVSILAGGFIGGLIGAFAAKPK